MTMRTLALATALTFGLGSAAMAQSVWVDTPAFGFSVGTPAPHVYGGYGYAPYGAYDAYAYSAPYAYGRVYGDFNTGRRWGTMQRDDYLNQNGFNSY